MDNRVADLVLNGLSLSLGYPAGLALYWAVFGEVADRNHCSIHPRIQQPSTDPELYQDRLWGQGHT